MQLMVAPPRVFRASRPQLIADVRRVKSPARAGRNESMKYSGYLQRFGQFESLFELIAARYNFDYGDEFEFALCDALRAILPERFGVCRGFIVASDGRSAGDDLIIFDRIRFPTLRLLRQDSFARKEQIPVEAVYAYIEAKHTLVLTGGLWTELEEGVGSGRRC